MFGVMSVDNADSLVRSAIAIRNNSQQLGDGFTSEQWNQAKTSVGSPSKVITIKSRKLADKAAEMPSPSLLLHRLSSISVVVHNLRKLFMGVISDGGSFPAVRAPHYTVSQSSHRVVCIRVVRIRGSGLAILLTTPPWSSN